MIFAFIAEHAEEWPVRIQCRAFDVTHRGYRAWCARERGRRAGESTSRQQEKWRLMLHIRAAFKDGRMVYGSPRIHRLLRCQGVRVSRKRVAQLMRQDGLSGARRRRKPKTTQSNHSLGVAPNILKRQFSPEDVGGIDRVWCSDITYLPASLGWLYLAVVLDIYSRRVVGWALGHSLEATLVVEALNRALATRGEAADGRIQTRFDNYGGLRLFHSDRGSQFAGSLCSERVVEAGFTPSMSRKGNCWDNAVVESFFSSLKSELVEMLPSKKFDSIEEAYRLIADYIDNFYNQMRPHSTLDYQSPIAFEKQNRARQNSSN